MPDVLNGKLLSAVHLLHACLDLPASVQDHAIYVAVSSIPAQPCSGSTLLHAMSKKLAQRKRASSLSSLAQRDRFASPDQLGVSGKACQLFV